MVADFGLAAILDYASERTMPGDVQRFGMLVQEVLKGRLTKTPVDSATPSQKSIIEKSEPGVAETRTSMSAGQGSGKYDVQDAAALWAIIEHTGQTDPVKRPTMQEIVDVLSNLERGDD